MLGTSSRSKKKDLATCFKVKLGRSVYTVYYCCVYMMMMIDIITLCCCIFFNIYI